MDIILYNILAGICCLIFGYFFGSIPTAIIVGKKVYHQDPREAGSKNAGATNMGRLFGKKAFFVTLIVDFLKAILPIWISFIILTFVPFGNNTLLPTIKEYIANGTGDHILVYPAYWLTAFGVTLGHCYPIFAHFKGGKGAADLAGIALGTCWLYALLPLVVFACIFKKVKTMSLSVIISYGSFIAILWVMTILILTGVVPMDMLWIASYGPTLSIGLTYTIVMTLNYIIMVIRHKDNIKRLVNHEEKALELKK